jgi:hypothetical protein
VIEVPITIHRALFYIIKPSKKQQLVTVTTFTAPSPTSCKVYWIDRRAKKPVTTTNDIGNNVQVDVTIYFILTNH